jgi:prepilin signal peptidase PulO-like enzyme (type II secretory pathway)
MISDVLWKSLFTLFSAAVAAADIKTGKVPRAAFVFAFPLFFILKVLTDGRLGLWESAAGSLSGLVVFMLAYFITGKKLGLADVWYSALVGMVLGPWRWYAAMGGACTAGAIYILVSKQRRIPFIPFMALGSVVFTFV